MDFSKHFRVCKECRIHHYSNCGSCFGFGVYINNSNICIPITAHEAHTKKFRYLPLVCLECGSDHNGIPRNNF